MVLNIYASPSHLTFLPRQNVCIWSLQICVSVFRKLYSFLQITLTPLSVCVCAFMCAFASVRKWQYGQSGRTGVGNTSLKCSNTPLSLPPMHTHQVQTTSFSLRDRKDRPQWILLLIFNEPPGLKTACLPLLFHIQETNNDSAGKHIGRPPSYLPVCLLAINPPTRPWIINASILCFARSAPSQQREWATSWLCGLQSVAMPLRVSPAGLLKRMPK